MLKETLKQEKTILREEIIKRISIGNFEELYPLLEIVLPISQEEKTQIIVNWYSTKKSILIGKYLLPLIDQDYELIKEIDKNNKNSFKR